MYPNMHATGATEITGLRPDHEMMEGVGAMEITGLRPDHEMMEGVGAEVSAVTGASPWAVQNALRSMTRRPEFAQEVRRHMAGALAAPHMVPLAAPGYGTGQFSFGGGFDFDASAAATAAAQISPGQLAADLQAHIQAVAQAAAHRVPAPPPPAHIAHLVAPPPGHPFPHMVPHLAPLPMHAQAPLPAHPATTTPALHMMPIHAAPPHPAAPAHPAAPTHLMPVHPAAPPVHPAAHPLHPHLTQVHHPGHHPTVHPGGALAYGGAPRVVERPLRDMREFPLGFFQSGIGLGVGVVEVISRPQIVFRGERLVIPSITVAPNFSLVAIKIDNRSQLVNSTALPAQAFTETAIGIRLSLDTATVAQDIALSVQNISGSPQTFQAALIGTAAQ